MFMKYENKIQIISTDRNDETSEESIEAEVNGSKIFCFSPGLGKRFVDRKEALVEIKLLVHDIKKSEQKEKIIESAKTRITNKTKVNGIVVHCEDFSIVLDCGMFVKIKTDGKKFDVGDYVHAEGRLDAYLVEKGAGIFDVNRKESQ